MTKLHILLIFLGSGLFFLGWPYGAGWLFGWIFVGTLRHYRERILEQIIDFDHFKTRTYIAYLLGVIVWITIPLLVSFLLPECFNPLAVFGAFFIDRLLMFFVNSFRKET